MTKPCPLCGRDAEVFTLRGVPIVACPCVPVRDGMVGIDTSRMRGVDGNPGALGDFSGERKLYATTMSDTPFGQRSEHVVSVVEARGHAPIKPTISDADRRKRARLAFDRVKGTTPVTETWTCDACGSSNISPGCKTCEALDEQVVLRAVEKLVGAPVVRSGIDPTDRLAPLPSALADVALVANMQIEMRLADFVPPGETRNPPTDEQRAAWSRALRARQTEAERKERHRVVLDLEWD